MGISEKASVVPSPPDPLSHRIFFSSIKYFLFILSGVGERGNTRLNKTKTCLPAGRHPPSPLLNFSFCIRETEGGISFRWEKGLGDEGFYALFRPHHLFTTGNDCIERTYPIAGTNALRKGWGSATDKEEDDGGNVGDECNAAHTCEASFPCFIGFDTRVAQFNCFEAVEKIFGGIHRRSL